MDTKTPYEPWYDWYFGKGTIEITGYIDTLNRLFLVPNNVVELPKDHNCDAMGCASAGPHIVGVYLPAEREQKLQAENKKLREALVKIDIWAKAYPLKAFPEPDLKKVAKVLKDAGLSLDAVSASNMRHVINGVKDITEQALKGE